MPDSDAWLISGDRREIALARIHAASNDVLRERGPKKFSLEEVARRAGCSRATVYRFVGNRQALLNTLVAMAAAEVTATVRKRTQGVEGRELVIESILAAVHAIRGNHTIGELIKSPPTFDDNYFMHSGMFNGFARTLMGLGEEHDLGAEWIIRVVLSLITWPLDDPARERELVERYVGVGF